MPSGATLLQLEDDGRESIPGATSENMGAIRALLAAHLAGTTAHLSVEGSIARPKAYSRAQTDANNQIKSRVHKIQLSPVKILPLLQLLSAVSGGVFTGPLTCGFDGYALT